MAFSFDVLEGQHSPWEAVEELRLGMEPRVLLECMHVGNRRLFNVLEHAHLDGMFPPQLASIGEKGERGTSQNVFVEHRFTQGFQGDVHLDGATLA